MLVSHTHTPGGTVSAIANRLFLRLFVHTHIQQAPQRGEACWADFGGIGETDAIGTAFYHMIFLGRSTVDKLLWDGGSLIVACLEEREGGCLVFISSPASYIIT